jgi:GTP-binding protein HflX
VVVGDAKQILLPDRKRSRSSAGRLSGIRYIHTHLRPEPLSEEDLADLALLRFDCVAAIEVGHEGLPEGVHVALLAPGNRPEDPWDVWKPLSPVDAAAIDFSALIRDLEKELARTTPLSADTETGAENRGAILVGVALGGVTEAEQSLEELESLADSCGVSVLDTILQRRPSLHPQFVVGKGKLKDLVIQALQTGAEMIIFDHDLTPNQMRCVTDFTEIKVLDRTQLILDIFAQRAKTRDGKIQVELAQLRYRLPRLLHRNTGLSRLAGGIGGTGPGETKLEIDRRRVRDRIHRLEKQVERLRKGRRTRRARRNQSGLPLVCLVGYTNAGKSTLLNALTQSDVHTENRLFATLDPTTRRLRLDESREALITDTVGFIRDLPPDLIAAFLATLEELRDAVLLVHVIDGSSDRCEKQLAVVEDLLGSLELGEIPTLRVFNKADKAAPEMLSNLCRRYHGIPVSALDRSTLPTFFDRLGTLLVTGKSNSPLKKTSVEEATPIQEPF